MLTRRQLCLSATTLSIARALPAQANATRPDVAAIDRVHILATADRALTLPLSDDLATGAIPALTAAAVLLRASDAPRAQACAAQAIRLLRFLFITPTTRLNNELTETNHPDDLVALAPLAEIAQAISFLLSQPSQPESPGPQLAPEEHAALQAWFAALLVSLNNSRTGGLARDRKDHVGGTWLFVAAASARVAADENALAQLRHHFKTVAIRAEILGDGTLPHELSTRTPYRNSLFALDLLAASADLLSTRFESLWDYELQDGPGMRTVIAKHAPWIASRASWPYPADQAHFNDLPCRRPALLFAAHAYNRPEYAAIWHSLTPAEPTALELLATFPVRQPLLWTSRPTR